MGSRLDCPNPLCHHGLIRDDSIWGPGEEIDCELCDGAGYLEAPLTRAEAHWDEGTGSRLGDFVNEDGLFLSDDQMKGAAAA